MNTAELKEEIEKSFQVLKQGGVIVYPTDTVWGIGCDAENESAVQKVLSIKNRKEGKSLIVLVNSIQLLHKYTNDFNPVCYDLAEISNKPITIIYPNACNLAKNIPHEDNSVGIRIVKHPFCEQLIRKLGRGIVSSSANISGDKTSGNFSSIPKEILEKADYVVNLERTEKISNPSSIIKIDLNGNISIIRK